MSSRVEVRQIGRRGRTTRIASTTTSVDAGDEEGCFALLRRLAGQHGLSAGEVEIVVKSGRHSEAYRL